MDSFRVQGKRNGKSVSLFYSGRICFFIYLFVLIKLNCSNLSALIPFICSLTSSLPPVIVTSTQSTTGMMSCHDHSIRMCGFISYNVHFHIETVLYMHTYTAIETSRQRVHALNTLRHINLVKWGHPLPTARGTVNHKGCWQDKEPMYNLKFLSASLFHLLICPFISKICSFFRNTI